MLYRIIHRAEVMEDFSGIPANMRDRIVRAIETRLGTAPDRYGKRLGKDLSGLWRLRVGDYRVVYELDPAEHLVRVWCVLGRRGVYPEIQRRWERR